MRQFRLPVVLFACLAMLVLAGYLYSPWHKHTPSKLCPFAGLDHSAFEQPVSGVALPEPAPAVWAVPDTVRMTLVSPSGETSSSRAPPVLLPA
jgi:hypothetical protein